MNNSNSSGSAGRGTVNNPFQALGESGEPCRSCKAPLAADQRYCLECGTRRGPVRVAFGAVDGAGGTGPQAVPAGFAASQAAVPGAQPAAAAPGPPPVPPSTGKDWTPAWLAAGMTALGVMLVVGVLLGRTGDGNAGAPVVQVAGAGGGVAAGAVAAPVSDEQVSTDWPEDQEGFTIELGSLPNTSTAAEVTAARDQLAADGAEDLGVLDSDLFGSLPEGNYVLYSGVYNSKAEAEKALKKIEGDFPDASVIKVSSSGGGGGNGGGGEEEEKIEEGAVNLDGLTAEEAQEEIKKVPDDYITPGKPPPKDDKKPGGGSDFETIE